VFKKGMVVCFHNRDFHSCIFRRVIFWHRWYWSAELWWKYEGTNAY